MSSDDTASLRTSLRYAIRIGLLLLAGLPAAAHGDIDPSGAWSMTVNSGGTAFTTVAFRRSGSSLAAHVTPWGHGPFSGLPSELTGSIDPVSGEFMVTGFTTCPGGSPGLTIEGTFSPSGDAFTGTADLGFSDRIGLAFYCSRAVGTATGTRTSVTCGNGALDQGEACEFDAAVPGCCTVDCQARSSGIPCTLNDVFCGFGLCVEGCSIGRCDGGGACVQAPRPAGTSCRRAVDACDIAESCDGTNLECPADQTVPPPDSDGDGLNDGCDPCTGGASTSRPRLEATQLTAPVNRRASARGTLLLPDLAVLDPVTRGLRLLVQDSSGLVYLDTTAPGGIGWTTTPGGWVFRDDGPIRSVKLKRKTSPTGAFSVTLRTRDAWLIGPPPSLPLKATVVLDPPFAQTGLCGELVFPGPLGVAPSCTLQRGGSAVTCR